MLSKIPEEQMHRIRWILTCGWLILIFSLFYDPISPWMTQPNNTLSPLRINPAVCIKVQGVCLDQKPYSLGPAIFWGIVVPSSIFILLVFGHEFWRRICPLSFLSQIFRAMGKQRQIKRVDPKSGKTRYELAKVKKDSWLGHNYFYLQFGLFYIGLSSRILFVNSDRLALLIFLIITILSGITVGYLYGGKAWCQYFCPMAPVQKIYGEPRGLLTSTAHIGDRNPITQSMCRAVNENGKEQSACVACQSPCIDIDAERSYWDSIAKPDQKFLYYGYVGLVFGYFCYYYLYAGNWDYYISGAWAHQENQLATLLTPGFYLFETPILIPKLVAVPLTLGVFAAGSYFLGRQVENRYKAYLLRKNQLLNPELIQHRIFTLCTFFIFNFFFVFGGRPFIILLPISLQYLFDISIMLVSTLWLYRTWGRSSDLYLRENLASRLRQQLSKLNLDVSHFLAGRSLDVLNPDEVYVLAKILPGFTSEKQLEAYKGVLRESIEEGYVNSANSLDVLQQMRQELGISDREHLQLLTELGVEDPGLFDPSKQRTKENQLRDQSFRDRIKEMASGRKRRRTAKGLGRDLLKVVQKEKSVRDVLQKKSQALGSLPKVQALSREYMIHSEEEEQILAQLDEEAEMLRKSDILLSQLQELTARYQALNPSQLPVQAAAFNLLRSIVQQKQQLIAKGLLNSLKSLERGSKTIEIIRSLRTLPGDILPNLLQERGVRKGLKPQVLFQLNQPVEREEHIEKEVDLFTVIYHLEVLFNELDPPSKSVSLYLIYHLNSQRSQELARQLLDTNLTVKSLVRETAQIILNEDDQSNNTSANFRTIEKLLYLWDNDLLASFKAESLTELAAQSRLKVYQAGEVVIAQGNKSKNLLLLIAGEAKIQINSEKKESRIEGFLPGQMLNELEILARTEQAAAIVATVSETQILEINAESFDTLLGKNPDLTRMLLAKQSHRLQELGVRG